MNFEELLKDPATKVTATTVGVVAIVIGILGKDVSGDQISDCLRIILFVLGSVVFLTGLSVTRYWARDANGNLTGKGQLVSGIAFGLGLVLLAGIGIGALVRNLGSEDRTTEVVNALGDYVESLQGTDAAKQQTAGYSVFAQCAKAAEISKPAVRAEVTTACAELLEAKGTLTKEKAKAALDAIAAVK